jgi:hypothetical protein
LVGTFNKIDYRLRPAKHAERIMLIDLFKRMRFAPIEIYQYVGLGSVAFVDFRMIHRHLGIDTMFSIEDTDLEEEKIRFYNNKPYMNLDLRFGHSSTILPSFNFSRRSLVWMDYDERVSRSMINDLTTIVQDILSGSFVALTFTNDFPTVKTDREYYFTKLREEFPTFIPEDAKPVSLDGVRYAEFVRTTFTSLLDTALADADAGKPDAEKRVALQVCYFKYSDGAPMATIGWIVVAEAELPAFEACEFEGLPFVRMGADPFRIRMPKVTPTEIREMERRMPDLGAGDLEWIPEQERAAFLTSYRYLPNFAPIEAI